MLEEEEYLVPVVEAGATVDTYRARIMEKLGLTHRSELVRFALRVGLLSEM